MAVDCVDHQRGLDEHLLRQLYCSGQFTSMSFMTQNPIMYHLLQKLLRWIYPSINKPEVEDRIQLLAKVIMQDRDVGFDYQTFIARDKYETPLYQQMPHSRARELNDWFSSRLGPQDCLLLFAEEYIE